MADCSNQGQGKGCVLIINNLIVSVPAVPWLDCVFSPNCKCVTLYIDNKFKTIFFSEFDLYLRVWKNTREVIMT